MLVEQARTPEPTSFAGASGTMQKIAVGPSALVLTPGSATAHRPVIRNWWKHKSEAKLTWPSRIEHNEASPVPQPTWQEIPSLMEASRRQWPSLTDF